MAAGGRTTMGGEGEPHAPERACTMRVLERLIQQVAEGQDQALLEMDRKHRVAQEPYGFPAGKRYRAVAGPDDVNTFVWESEWESLAAMEAAYERWLAEPQAQALGAELGKFVSSARWEFWEVLE